MLQRPTLQQEPKVSLGQQSAEPLSTKTKTTDIATRAERFTGTTIGRRSFFPPRPKQPKQPQGRTQEEVSFWI
jgi:hypothetical protein